MLSKSLQPVLIRMLSFLDSMIQLAVVNPMCTSLKAARQQCQQQKARALEIHIDEAAEVVLPPVVAVEQQRVPAALAHQPEELLVSVSIQHA